MSILDGLLGGVWYDARFQEDRNRQMEMQIAAQLNQMAMMQRQTATAAKHGDVIDGEYEVIEQQAIEHNEANTVI